MKLQKFTGSRPHQNVVLKCTKLDYLRLKRLSDIEGLSQGPPKEGLFYLFLDQITDPQNFGSILRSAMFIGVDGVIVNHKNACGLTPTVSKVSSGALEFIPLYSARFIKKFLEDSQKGPHKFKIISTDIDSSNDEDGPERKVEVPVEVQDSDTEDEEINKILGKESKFLREIKDDLKRGPAKV